MAVTQKGFFFQGLSGDTKPTTGITTSDRFLETNTGKEFIWSGAAWVPALSWTNAKLLKGAGVGVAPTEIDVPSVDYPMKLKPALERWVIPGWYLYTILSKLMVATRIYYIPIFVSETTTYIRIGVSVNVLSAGTADLRIFNWSNGQPGSLVLSAGTVDTGSEGVKEIIIAQQLTRGYYFLAVRCTGTPALYGIDMAQSAWAPVSATRDSMTEVNQVIGIIDAAYADPAPAPGALSNLSWAVVRLREN